MTKQIVSLYKMEIYTALKKTELPVHMLTWTNLKTKQKASKQTTPPPKKRWELYKKCMQDST